MASAPCAHCKTRCGPIVARGLGRLCYERLRRQGRLGEYPTMSRAGISYKTRKHHITPEIHELIREVYQSDTGGGQVRDLCLRTGLPAYTVSRYARAQGWLARQPKEPDWRPEELRLLKEYARYAPAGIRKKLLEHGYRRSETGIVLKRKRLGLLRDLGGVSATRLGNLMGVDSHNITDAIKQGLLRAERRETNRTAAQGGDAWFIRPGDIREYIVKNIHDIDIRKVDKYWFVELLTSAPAPARKRRPDDGTMELPFGPGKAAPQEGAPPAVPYDEIHADDDYFYCERMRCTLRKVICVRRQTEVLTGGDGHVMIECRNCSQGLQVAAELGVTATPPQARDLKNRPMIHARRTYHGKKERTQLAGNPS